MKENKEHVVSFRVTPKLKKKLEQTAKHFGTTQTELIEKSIEELFEQTKSKNTFKLNSKMILQNIFNLDKEMEELFKSQNEYSEKMKEFKKNIKKARVLEIKERTTSMYNGTKK